VAHKNFFDCGELSNLHHYQKGVLISGRYFYMNSYIA
jgi:hypothetical protein